MQPAPAPGPAGPTARYPEQGSGIARYLFVRRDSVVATMPSGEQQVQLGGRSAWLTLTWVAGDSGTRLTATIDSVVSDSQFPASPMSLDSARGTRFTALRLPTGRLSGMSESRESLVGSQVRDQLALLFPLLPPDGASPGARWTDSTSGPVQSGAFAATELAQVTAEAGAVADQSHPGAAALPLAVTRARTLSGGGDWFGQPYALTGQGQDSLTYAVTPDGRVLEAEGTRATGVTVSLQGIGQSVPVVEVSLLRMVLTH
jgi:hypothetical protein